MPTFSALLEAKINYPKFEHLFYQHPLETYHINIKSKEIDSKNYAIIGSPIWVLFFRTIGPIITGMLKSFHEKHNPSIVEKAPWIFTGFDFFYKAFSILCLIFIILIWLVVEVISS